jgi:hypothetical protein
MNEAMVCIPFRVRTAIGIVESAEYPMVFACRVKA